MNNFGMAEATIRVPENLLFTLRENINSIVLSMEKEYAIKMFQESRLTLVQAADFCGLDLYDFTALLSSRHIPVIDYSVESLERELKANGII
jgi:predicted HTH domain antitoxin